MLGFVEDYSSVVKLDSDLTALPLSGIYLNSGVHPSITLNNLLAFLPNVDIVFDSWNNSSTYNLDKIVVDESLIYQSLKNSNVNKKPSENTVFWLPTNIESLRLKSFIKRVLDRAYAELNIQKRLINNQFLYEVSDKIQTLSNDYAGWMFQPKGSDYVAIRLNQVSLQKDGATPVNLYVINQGILIDTLTVTPSNGTVVFKDLNYTFKGNGDYKFVIDSTDVYTNGSIIDPLKYDGFVVNTVSGIGESPGTAKYSYSVAGNGLGFNITAYLDSEIYIYNNVNEFATYFRATFEMMCFEMFLSNSNNRSNRDKMIQMDDKILSYNLYNLTDNTVAKRYQDAKKQAIKQLQKTFDTQLLDEISNDYLEIESTSL